MSASIPQIQIRTNRLTGRYRGARILLPWMDPGFTCEVEPDFLEHARREELDQPELPWEP